MREGKLIKLTIIPFKDADNTQSPVPAGPPFVCPFNPESFSVATSYRYEEDKSDPKDGFEAKFERVEPKTFSFDIFLDETGASGPPQKVLPMIELFKKTVDFKGDIHRPSFVKISYGTFLMDCVLESYTINYKMFRPSGLPLRAVISTSWKEYRSSSLLSLVANLLSPDVTHLHTVKEGDDLSLITYQTYKNPKYYLQVAEKNKLDNLRRLKTNSVLQLHRIK